MITRSASSASRPTARSCAKKEAEGFALFGRLPKEVRLWVYELAFPHRVLRFCQQALPGHSGLVVEPLGPPVIAQTCREAWEFAKAQYHCLTYHSAMLFVSEFDDRPTIRPPPKQTWFNPRVDVLCINAQWDDIAKRDAWGTPESIVKWGITQEETHPDNANFEERGKRSMYSEIVRSIQPFAKIAETVVVKRSPNQTVIASHDFFPYADDRIFPKLKTVLITVQYMDWDDSEFISRPGEPRPKWSVRVLDVYSPAFTHQVDLEFGQLDQKRLLRLLHDGKQLARICRSAWDSRNPDACKVVTIDALPDADNLSNLAVVNMWLQAAYFLRKGYTVSETGDKRYWDYRSWFWRWWDKQRYPEVDAVLEEWKNNGSLPHFEAVLMVHKAPLV